MCTKRSARRQNLQRKIQYWIYLLDHVLLVEEMDTPPTSDEEFATEDSEESE